jgi:outer membrane protein assembly factor BamB
MKLLAAILILPAAQAQPQEPKAPFRYVWADAHHILPETTSEESGYFALCEGRDGLIYVGSAKYGANSYLVEFDPKTARQQVVLDTHKVCGLTATGYAAQAKLHTRNFVAPSGRIYVGSKQGYRKDGDTSEYPGGYVMRYDPGARRAENLGMPFPGQGVIDVVADEARGLMYVVTCEDQHWMVGDLKSFKYREIGPMLTPYATTLVDRDGRAHAVTKEFKLASYDPATGRASVRDIVIDGEVWSRANNAAIPTWNLAADGRTAYLVLMNDVRLVRIDLATANATRLGTMVEGTNPDSRCGLSIAPDGRVYVVARVDNKTGFGDGYLHYLARYDPAGGRIENLGVLAVKNPDYYDFAAKKPWSHGFHRLPDGTLTLLHVHMALVVAHDGTIYATSIYPFTLLRIRPKDLPQSVAPKRVAAVVTAYYHNSHADVIASRLLETDTLDDRGRRPALELASLYTDQIPESPADIGQGLAAKHGVRVSKTVEDALTLGTGKLAVDGVLLIAEHGQYPRSATGQIQYPKRRLFGQIAEVFEKCGRAVPVFCDKHLSDTWEDAKWIHDTAARLKAPLMAGSSLPVLWRYPPADLPRDAQIEEVVATSYHTLDAYGFHALEMVQALVERRKGGETGIKAVRCIEGPAVWESKLFDAKLLDAALGRLTRPAKDLVTSVPNPVLFRIEYADGLKASVLTLNHAVGEWAVAWRLKGGTEGSTLFWTQEARPFMHFTYLVEGIEEMMHAGRPSWPAERTLLTSGALDALLISKAQGGKRLQTPQLEFSYRSSWDWGQPPPPPPGRPIPGR